MIQRLAAVCLVGVLLTACGDGGGPAPDWQLPSVDGRTVRAADFKGRVVIVDFWATWCPPCRKGIPELIELQQQYGPRGLSVVGISLDQGGVDVVRPFLEKHGVNYPVVMGNDAVVSVFGGIRGIPTAFVIDRQGRIIDKHVGYTPKATLEQQIKRLL